jgi:hypothetical protein
MKDDKLITQIETYSNAIIGFIVLQAIAYSFSFGTNEFFNCLVKTARYLAYGLAAHFLIVTILACYATLALGRLLRRLSQENGEIVGRIYLAKCIVVVLFTSVPLATTVAYGLLDYPSKYECKQTKHAA